MASSTGVFLVLVSTFLLFQGVLAQTTRSPLDVSCAGYCTNPATAPTGIPPADVGNPPLYTALVNGCTNQFCCCDAAALGCQYNNQQVTCDPGYVFDPNVAAPGYTCRPLSEMNQIAQCCAWGNVTVGCPSTTTQRTTTRITSPVTTQGTTTSAADVTCSSYCANPSTAPNGPPPSDVASLYTAYRNACTNQFCCCDAATLGCAFNGQQVNCDPGQFFDPNPAAPGYTCRPLSEMNQVAQCCAAGNVTTGCPTTTTSTPPTTIQASTTRPSTTVVPTTTVPITTTRTTTVVPVSTTIAPTTIMASTTRPSTTVVPTTTVPITTTRTTTVVPASTTGAPTTVMASTVMVSTTPPSTTAGFPSTTTAGFPPTTTAGAPPPTTTSASCAGCGCGTPSLSTQSQCVESTVGPTGNAQWKTGLNTNVDQILLGGDVVAYQIQWSNSSWSGWYITGVNDIDVVPGTCGLRRMWAYFADLTHKYIICSP
ncbi:hypothetical protein RvY_15048 [Ramazzottius varieornatus]|uniref:Chitin-binding type-2 domain-containing protein n=1 Tax=Ramazzottius varieornatus TaxID=947166 RepID=A0A1D1VYC5_RAMVA|nr:hypothetical protein RvY_15048 [Ramazzottius varieornatus]